MHLWCSRDDEQFLRLFGELFRAFFRHKNHILYSYATSLWYVNPRLHGKTHSRLNGQFILTMDRRVFMYIDPESMPNSMWKEVAISSLLNILASYLIHFSNFRPNLTRFNRLLLSR